MLRLLAFRKRPPPQRNRGATGSSSHRFWTGDNGGEITDALLVSALEPENRAGAAFVVRLELGRDNPFVFKHYRTV
jgi:hypothetical protein